MEFFKSEKQRISYRDAGVVFLLLFVIVVMAFDEATAGMPHSERLQNDILPIIAITLCAIAAILFVKAKNEVYYLQNALQILASWHRDPLSRIEDFAPPIYGAERDIARSVVLYAMMTMDAPDPEKATGQEPYYRHTAVAKINIHKVAARGLDLQGQWRSMYLVLRALEKQFYLRFPRTEDADPVRLYHLRALLLLLYGKGGAAALQGDFWNSRVAGDYLSSAEGFPSLSEDEKEAVAELYRDLAREIASEENEQASPAGEESRAELLMSAAGVSQ